MKISSFTRLRPILFCFLFLPHINSNAQLQIVYPPNSSFDYVGFIQGVPNHISPPSWFRRNPATTPDVCKTGITNYGMILFPEYNSSDGEPWLRCIDIPNQDGFGTKWQEGVFTTVTGLNPGQDYYIKFEQAIVAAQINKAGRWNVTLGGQTINGPWMTPPVNMFEMSTWSNVSLGPFTATASTMTIILEAEAQNQMTMGNFEGCDLALDGIYLEAVQNGLSASNDSVNICNNITNNTLIHKVVVNGHNGDTLTYSIIDGNIENTFSIDTTNGEIKVNDSDKIDRSVKSVYHLMINVNNTQGDSAQCTITININPSIEFTTTVTDVSCSTYGSITVSSIHGVPPIEYSIDNGVTYQVSNIFVGLNAGTYNITVRDVHNCTRYQSVEVGASTPLVVDDVITTDENCSSLGSIKLNISGGVPPIAYSIDSGTTFSFTNTFNGLTAGTYNTIVKDANLCTVNQLVTVNYLPTVSINSVTTTNETCSSLGSLSITTSEGPHPIEFSIDNGISYQASNSFTGLNAGTYNISVRDSNHCTDHTTATITRGLEPNIDSIIKNDLTCSTFGSITIVATGGTLPMKYSINNGNSFQNSNKFEQLDSGTYQIVVRDAELCEKLTSVEIKSIENIVLDTVKVENESCLALGALTIYSSKGKMPFQYSIDNGATFSSNNSFTDLKSGVYNIKVKDHNNCLVEESIALDYDNISLNTTVVQSANTLEAQLNNAQYRWLDCNNDFKEIPAANYQKFTASKGGKYAVEISKANCIDTSACHLIVISGLEDVLSSSIRISPNPTAKKTFISLNKTMEKVNVQLVNIYGQMVINRDFYSTEIIELNLEGNTGAYFLQIYYQNKLISKEIIIKQ